MIIRRKNPETIAFFSQLYNIIMFSIDQSQRNFRELAVENNLLQSAATVVSLIKTYTKEKYRGYPLVT